MLADFRWKLRVYYEDTDAGGVVFYANYLKFFERARTEWLRAHGVEQQALRVSDGVMFVVASTALDYLRPARLDDELEISVVVERMGRASVDFMQTAWRRDGGESVAISRGKIRVGCVRDHDFSPCAIPDHVRARIAGPAT